MGYIRINPVLILLFTLFCAPTNSAVVSTEAFTEERDGIEDESEMGWFANETDVQQDGYGLSIPDEDMMRRIESKIQVVTELLTEEELDALGAVIERGGDPDLCQQLEEHSHRQKRQTPPAYSECDVTCNVGCKRSKCGPIMGYRPTCRCNMWGHARCNKRACPTRVRERDPCPVNTCSKSCKKGSCTKTGYRANCECVWFKRRPRCTSQKCPS